MLVCDVCKILKENNDYIFIKILKMIFKSYKWDCLFMYSEFWFYFENIDVNFDIKLKFIMRVWCFFLKIKMYFNKNCLIG